MFRVKLPNGTYAWLTVDYIQAVAPGPDLATAVIVMRDQAQVLVAGIADELGLAIAQMKAGVIPLVDLRENKA